jgi:nickel transport protein
MKRFGIFFLAASFLLVPAAAFAHGVDILDVTGRAGVRSLRFVYSTGEPMLFAQVKVYSPSAPEATVQETMSDREGYFSFVPFEDGPWRISVEDGMGHRGEITVAVAGGGGAEAAPLAAPVAAPLAAPDGAGRAGLPALLGISLIFNVFGLWYALKKKFPRREAARAH